MKPVDVASATHAMAGKVPDDKLSIVMSSGTADKFIPLGIFVQSAAAIGMEVNVLVTGFALHAFTKEPHDVPFPTEFLAVAPALTKGMQASHIDTWQTMLAQAKKLGAKVYACSMMSSAMGLRREDFNDLVDDLIGAATFLLMAEHGETLFI